MVLTADESRHEREWAFVSPAGASERAQAEAKEGHAPKMAVGLGGFDFGPGASLRWQRKLNVSLANCSGRTLYAMRPSIEPTAYPGLAVDGKHETTRVCHLSGLSIVLTGVPGLRTGGGRATNVRR